mmetsp:Transcript_75088/g.176286  ORF Transcript_75088/g.176286 Transcript_75088/m.176286 type:complete len:204 (-) Transcript_75088:282-893(-)
MRGAKDSGGRCLIDAAGFDSDETVLNEVHAANTVAPGQLVQEDVQVDGTLHGLAFALDLDRGTINKVDAADLFLVGPLRSGEGLEVHLLLASHSGVLQNTTFVADVHHVVVHAVRGSLSFRKGDSLLPPVGQEVGSALELGDELCVSPRGDHLDGRVESVVRELEADLVVALTGRAVRHVRGADALGHFDLPLRDDRARQTRS